MNEIKRVVLEEPLPVVPEVGIYDGIEVKPVYLSCDETIEEANRLHEGGFGFTEEERERLLSGNWESRGVASVDVGELCEIDMTNDHPKYRVKRINGRFEK